MLSFGALVMLSPQDGGDSRKVAPVAVHAQVFFNTPNPDGSITFCDLKPLQIQRRLLGGSSGGRPKIGGSWLGQVDETSAPCDNTGTMRLQLRNQVGNIVTGTLTLNESLTAARNAGLCVGMKSGSAFVVGTIAGNDFQFHADLPGAILYTGDATIQGHTMTGTTSLLDETLARLTSKFDLTLG